MFRRGVPVLRGQRNAEDPLDDVENIQGLKNSFDTEKASMIAAVAQGNCGSTFFEIVGLAAEDVEKNECKEDHFDREKQAGDAN